MNAIRLGLSIRALRIRRGLRQLDAARMAGVSRSTVSAIERGAIGRVALETLGRLASVVGADIDVRVRWRGEQLDRLLDEGHARLVDTMARRLRDQGWEVAVEVTFSIRGERGSIDLLAYHPVGRALLIVEIKSVMPDFQATVAAHDRKMRLGSEIARQRGWSARSTSRLLVIEAGSTARDRVRRLDAAMEAAYPVRGAAVRAWLRSPGNAISGLLFVRSAAGDGVPWSAAGRQRVRRPNRVRNG